MKTILTLSILFWAIALTALGELPDTDLNKIRLIVNEAEKRIKEEIKTEITDSEKRMKDHINLKTETVNAKINGQEKRLSQNFWLILALIALIALPQVFIAWRSRKDRALETQIENLTQEIETLKKQQIVNP